jgi:hypothetical protein
MSVDFAKDFLPIWCEQCNAQGYIFVDSIETPYFVTCKECGQETSEVFCPKCKMGGEYVKGIKDRPTSWICPGCSNEYSLPTTFYEHPVPLYLEEDLPDSVRLRVMSSSHYQNTTLVLIMGGLGLVAIYAMFIFGVAGRFGIGFLIASLSFVVAAIIGYCTSRRRQKVRSGITRQPRHDDQSKAKIDVRILTPLKPSACAKKMRRRITSPQASRNKLPRIPTPGEVVGEVYAWTQVPFRFRIRKRRFFLNSIAPCLEGRIYYAEDGSRIEVRASYFGVMWRVVFLLIVAFFLLSMIWVTEGFALILFIASNPIFLVVSISIIVLLASNFLVGASEIEYLKQFVQETFS